MHSFLALGMLEESKTLRWCLIIYNTSFFMYLYISFENPRCSVRYKPFVDLVVGAVVVVVVVGVMVVAAAAVATAFCIVVYAHIAYEQ